MYILVSLKNVIIFEHVSEYQLEEWDLGMLYVFQTLMYCKAMND